MWCVDCGEFHSGACKKNRSFVLDDKCWTCGRIKGAVSLPLPTRLRPTTPIRGPQYCSTCGHQLWYECSHCAGKGELESGYCTGCGRRKDPVLCFSCDGQGWTRNVMPHQCAGKRFPWEI